MKEINASTIPTRWRFERALRSLLIYGALAGGSILFIWPMLWMAGTSFKSGHEIVTHPTAFAPQRPIPRGGSPYIDHREYPPAEGRDAEILPAIEERLKAMNVAWPPYAPREEAIEVTGRGLLQRLHRFLPADAWKQSPAALAARVDQPMVEQTLDQARRELCLGSLFIRSLDVQEQMLAPETGIAASLHVQEGNHAALEGGATNGGKACAVLHYDLSSRDDVVRISQVYTTDFPVDRLYRVQLALRSDESWNEFDVYVERLGVKYRSESPTVLSDTGNWSVLTWQMPGRDDQSNKVRIWTTLREVDRSPQYVSDPHQMRITCKVRRVGPARAWWEKMSRNYSLALDYIPFWRYVATSLFLVMVTVTATLFSCSFVAYSFARLKWPGRRFCFVLMLATMMIPYQITMIPQFLIVRSLGWYNTLLPLWVPSLFGSAFFIFLLVQFLRGVPKDLEDAARIDGCGFFRIYWHIMLPLVRPTLAAIAVLTFVGTWNDFMGPLIYIGDQRLYPLSFGLYAFTVQASADAGLNMSMTMAGALLMTLPVIGLFFLAQRYFIQGVTLSGMK